MESRLKERLTGAAILVALIVLLVPEIFRGQRGNDASPSAGGNGSEGAPLRSYTIDLSNNPKGSVPLQPAESAAVTGTDTAVHPSAPKVDVAPAKEPMPMKEPVPAKAAAPPPSPAPPASSPAPAGAASARTAAATPAPPSSHVIHAAPPPTPQPVPAPAPKPSAGSWSVQLGLFAKRENAERLLSEARAKGFQVAISSADAKGQFHVRSSGLADRASAETLAQRLKSAGFPAAVVAPK